jgi:hypothetical protein
MDDDLDILAATDLAADGVFISYELTGNPFSVRSTKDMFSSRLDTNRKARAESDAVRHRTLVQRTEMAQPRVTSLETRATKIIHSSQSSRQSPSCLSVTLERPPRERKATMHEFREDKREIYKTQLFIDRKRRDLRQLKKDQKTAENGLTADLAAIAEREARYKTLTIRLEVAVAHRRKLADVAARATAAKKKELRQSGEETESIRRRPSPRSHFEDRLCHKF